MALDDRGGEQRLEIVGDKPEQVIALPQAVLRSSLYINRELGLVQFNERVLDEALDERNPLLERVKFLSIFNSNTDEFFMVRASGIREQVKAGISDRSPDGMTPQEELWALRQAILPLLDRQSELFTHTLQPALAKQGVRIADYEELTPEQKRVARDYFDRMVFPVSTPLAVDPGHPFPHISNLSLNLAVELQAPNGRVHFARVKVPNVLSRLVALPVDQSKGGKSRTPRYLFTWLEQVLMANLDALFPAMQIVEVHPFRVIRDADIEIQELEAYDLLETVEQSLSRRRFGSAVALFHNPGMSNHLRDLLVKNLELDDIDVYEVDGPLGLSDLMEVYRLDRADLKDPVFVPRIPAPLRKEKDVFAAIRRGDILLHHPFDSFKPVVDFIRTAAEDKDVLAIKMTLYRVGADSPIVEALLDAVQAGKQVAVLVELKARFDEENNIEWAKALEQAGVHVTYGLIGLKTHCKVALVVRKEGDALRRYVHLGTGNYNPTTARLYTDMGLLTCSPDFGADASDLFNYLTGYSQQTRYRKLLVAPIAMRAGLLALIEREIKQHRERGNGRLIFKMNSLVDPALIEVLYRASQAGVKVDLLVRGICCLRPGVPNVSENIRVISIVGRFLEHSRIFYFRNNGKEDLFMGSADLMPRNLDHRVETLFPIEDEGIKRQVISDVLESYLRDNVKARILQSDGTYVQQHPGKNPGFDVQLALLNEATGGENGEMTLSVSALPNKYRKYLSSYGRVDPHS
ncbi:MAG TPA: polyphosphate kinase 1 [Chloroflexia bacterium]|nr:polyphosphate kinase 1 [Chloroflexia bacterium]